MIDTLQAWDEALLLWLNGNPLWMQSAAWILTAKWTTFPVVLLVLVKLMRRWNANFFEVADPAHGCDVHHVHLRGGELKVDVVKVHRCQSFCGFIQG